MLSFLGREMKRRRTGPARGQATVELALIFMFLALLLIGIADVARIYSEHLTVVQAAGVGARWYVLDPDHKGCSGYTDVEGVVRDAIGGAIPTSDINSVQVVLVANGARVNVTYTHRYLFGLINNVPGQFTGQATMPGQPDTSVGICPPTPIPPPTNSPTVTFTPAPPTATPTNSRTPTVTATPTPCAVLDQLDARKRNGRRAIEVSVTVETFGGQPISGANVTAHVDGTNDTFPLSEVSLGRYQGCSFGDYSNSGQFEAGDLTVVVSPSCILTDRWQSQNGNTNCP